MIDLLQFIAGWFALKEEVEPEPERIAYMTISIEGIPADLLDTDAPDTSPRSEATEHGTH